jgi:hypothetical protein
MYVLWQIEPMRLFAKGRHRCLPSIGGEEAQVPGLTIGGSGRISLRPWNDRGGARRADICGILIQVLSPPLCSKDMP